MPVRLLTPASVSPTSAAQFDLLSDGQWHHNGEIAAAGIAACIAHERDEALKQGRRVRSKALAKGATISEDDIVASGAKEAARNRLMVAVRSGRVERSENGKGNEHRMLPDAVAQWTTAREQTPAITTASTPAISVAIAAAPATDATACGFTAPAVKAPKTNATATAATQDASTAPAPQGENEADATATDTTTSRYRKPLEFGGMGEFEGFADAPLRSFTRVHYRTDFPIPMAKFRTELPTGTTVTHDEGTGLYRVDHPTMSGTDLAETVKTWCAANAIITEGLRPEPRQVRRRSLHDLNPRFLSDLCVHYSPYSLKRLQRNMSTLKMHFNENEEIVQRINEWILEAVAQFDDTKGVPFGAFLAQRLTAWVHDLNRNTFGRVLTDHENKTHTVIAKFQQTNHRLPTDEELAAALGQTLPNLRKNATAVATINALRNIGTIDGTFDGDGYEVALPDDNRVEDEIMDDLEKSVLSAALTKACAPDPDAKGRAAQPNVLGLVTLYATTWGGSTKTDLSARMDTSMRNMNVYAGRAGEKMAASLG